VKKRNRSRRQQSKSHGGSWLGGLGARAKSGRRSWTFERLEERNYFTATPLTGLEGMASFAVSNSTAEGQQLIDAIQQSWYSQMTGAEAQSGVSSVALSLPTDPYLNYQWHLFNVGQVVNPGQFQDLFGVPGQDINVIPAWDQGYTGAGVTVAVVDEGVQLDHPDLISNLEFGYDAIRNRPGGGEVFGAPHGTAVAGLIGAEANNGLGGVGVAYGSTIYPIRFLGTGSNEQSFINAIGANGADIDIYNHSWGYFNGRSVTPLSMNQLIALTNSARLGRDGLGAIHVFAAGNFAESLYSAGSSALVNSRYTIGVGIVDHDGKVANSDGTSTGYGNMAPSVLIVAPSASGPTDIINNFATGSGLFTTDLTAPDEGYNVAPLPSGVELDIDGFPDDDYTSRFGGTSGAAPLVSGVIALMLEANPNLTYRDVQEILVRSARQNDDLDESWITNLVPLFRDPVEHNFNPTNYPIDPDDPFYPSDETQWNDEIVYQLVSSMPIDPAVQASTEDISVENSLSTFKITAVADNAWDGWVGNNLSVVFETEPDGLPGAFAEIVEGRIPSVDMDGQVRFTDGKLRITVVGDVVTWGEIRNAIELLGQNPLAPDPMDAWFDVIASGDIPGNPEIKDPLFEIALFHPADEAIVAPLTGGIDARGSETVLQRNPQYSGYHPIADPITNPEPDSLFTNGAGFTVSHGRGGNSEYGWAHGVVNAGLAVELAKQWHLKDQNLPPEKTYLVGRGGTIRLRAAQITDEASGEYVIPGALSWATEGFADYFNEFFKEPTITAGVEATETDPATSDSISPDSLPFAGDDPPVNTRGGFDVFDVPAIDPVTGASNLMSLEWVEVHLTISGGADAMNYVKITLVSPDGTHSELTQNQYRPDDINHNFQSMATGGVLTGFEDSITPQDDTGNNSDTLDWVYSTNRIWGERSDSKPVFDEYGNLVDINGWELHFENYSGTDLLTSNIQIAFHGAPLGSQAGPVERIMGKVGVDSGRFIQAQDVVVGANDGAFNFDRYVTTTSSDSHALTSSSSFSGGITPFGEHEILIADENQELFAGNITVYAIDNSNGQRVAEFLTGYDGNYYFDLPEGEYTIGIEDPLEREALADGRNYDNEWVVTIDTGDQFTRTAGEIDAISGKLNMFDDFNFLLDPGSIPAGEVVFTGQVIGDLDGDAIQDAVDTGVYNFNVYADLNHTGQFDIGEPFTLTDIDGNYELHVPTGTPNTFSIGVKPPTGWTTTSPASQFHLEYSLPGEQTDGIDFLVNPPSSPSTEGNGYIFGFIFNDRNGDGEKQEFELGLPGRTVFIDANQNGDFDAGEISTITNSSGAYQFGEVIVGTVRIDTVVEEPYQLTSPLVVGNEDGYIQVTLVAGQVSTGNFFGVQNQAINDFGDLVGDGFKTYGEGNASHFVVPGFSLGATIDAEIRPRNLVESAPDSGFYVPDPALHGIGDDQIDPLDEAIFDDEDGVVLVGGILRRGANALSVTVQGVGGYLQGWIDFNNDGDFDVSERVFDDLDLNPGTHQLLITAPQSLLDGLVAARFRWGTLGLGAFGSAIIGEVEDYLFEAKADVGPGDYNADDLVNDDDYLLWKSTFGSTTDLRADGNMNGVVDSGDYTVWRNNLGAGPGPGGGGGLASEPAVVVSAVSQAPVPLASLSPQLSVQVPQLGGQLIAQNGADDVTVLGDDSMPSTTPVAGASSLASDAFDAPEISVSLVGVPFSTSIRGDDSASVVSSTSGPTAMAVDSVLLLLTPDSDHEQTDADGLSGGAGLEWGKDEGGHEDSFELAVAAAFDDESNWWLAL
jgi:subtilisin family serine protease